MERMIEYIEKIREIDTEGVEPLVNVFENKDNVFREDEVTNDNTREDIMKNAPLKDKDVFVVPKTV